MSRVLASTRCDMLPNGLRVLTREAHHAPVASVMVWYGVGSRDERPGITGISHFLEHMMFKGTPRFPQGVVEEGVKRRGGTRNAFTSYDYTAYFEVLPSHHLEFGLEVEADRMVNMTFDPALTLNERGVIVSEREGSENSPQRWLQEVFLETAFEGYPYSHPVIGTKDDIKAITADALTEHYRRYYRPNNATVVLVGDFETGRVLELVQKHFGDLPRGEEIDPLQVRAAEPAGERRCEVRRPGPNPYMLAGYLIPPAGHADDTAVLVLSAILSGAASLSPGGGGMGRSSRFQRLLVNRGVAAGASASAWTFQHAGLLVCRATPVSGVAPAHLEEELLGQLEAIRQDPVSADELERARKQLRAQFLYGMETVSNQAMMLGATAMAEGVERFDRALEEIDAVTADDVLRVARTYLDPVRRTVSWFLPDQGGTAAGAVRYEPPKPDVVSTPDHQKPGHPDTSPLGAAPEMPILPAERVVRRELPGGCTLLVYPAASVPSVFVRVQMEAGAVHHSAAEAGLAQLTAQLLTRGSRSFSAEELALKTDALGMAIRAESGRETTVAMLKCLPEDLATGLDLLAEVIRYPVIPDEEVSLMRERMLVGVREAMNDTRSVAARSLAESLYPEGHPLRHPLGGAEESLQALTAAGLRRFHAGCYGPAGAVITVVGNVDPTLAEERLRAAFDGWSGGAGRPALPEVAPPGPSRHHVALLGKTQTDIAAGWPLVDRSHPDYLALEFLATLFGGNGLTASTRMRTAIRERHGLSYYQYASFHGSTGPSAWTLHLGVNPGRVNFALEVLRAELRRLSEAEAPEQEVAELQTFVSNYLAVQHESPERVAARLAEIERFQLGLDYLDRYPAMVRALTPASLRETASRHLDVDRLAAVTAGPPDA